MPVVFAMEQNYPNPFNPTTTIKYDLPVDAKVSLKVYDVLGREVMTLVEGHIPAGYHDVKLKGNGLASGIYFYRLEAGTFRDVKKLLLLR